MVSIINQNASDELLEWVRTEYRNLPIRELLRLSPHVLLGVSQKAADALKLLEINTLFDLATSSVFDAASKLLNAASDIHSALSQHGTPTADLVRESVAAGVKVNELQFLPISALQGVPESEAAGLQQVLDVSTIRDFALYPPYRAALRLLNVVYFPENAPNYDPERPADLLPKTGEYPTERVQYTTLLMDQIHDDNEKLIDIASPSFKPIDIGALAAGDAGFKKIAFGALLTFNQSWYAQGVTLGQLLHSTALAPGESTRIAVIDWSRRSRAGETETISEVDDLTNDTTHNRSISEVTEAVAREAQSGFSETNATSTSSAKATASAEELSAPLGGLFGGPSGSAGQTSSTASTTSAAESYSTSYGHREIGSTMLQNVNDRTHQHAHSSRSRRASVVKEVSQSEHEGVSTRVIANYNHMHALTIQYYEVVQVYRVETAIVKADKVVFIPIELIDFNKDALVRRFRSILSRAALTYSIREALINLDVLEIVPNQDTFFININNRINVLLREASISRTGYPVKPTTTTQPTRSTTQPAVTQQSTSSTSANTLSLMKGDSTDAQAQLNAAMAVNMPSFSLSHTLPVFQQVNDALWTIEHSARVSRLLNRAILRSNSASTYLPTDVTIEGVVVNAGGTPLAPVFHTLSGKAVTTVDSAHPLDMSDVSQIGVIGSSPEADLSVRVVLTLNRNGVRFPFELPLFKVYKGAAGETTVVQIKLGGVDANLKEHLSENRMHYSQAVYRSLDSTQLAFLLAGYGVEVGGKMVPVSQVVEPRPIRYIGNYLAFKMNTDSVNDPEWAKWLDEHGIHLGHAKEDIIPLPSGGTFAEAVLGRSNSAEKLDITRFWNWQDSPIPLQAMEIAAIQTGSRAMPEDVKPGQLSNPIINITSPTSLPDPTGTAAILAAIQNGNLFRDMSGLQGTIGLAQAALQATSAGAATAGQQAGENMNNLLKANTERQRIAAEMITSLAKTAASVYSGGLAGGGGGGISGGSNHSQDGAKINYFDKTQGQNGAASGGASGGGGGAVAPVSGGGSSSGGTPAGGGAGYSQNPAALAATWGDSQSRSGVVSQFLDKVSGAINGSAGDSPASSPLEARKAWPKLDPTQVLTRIEQLKNNANLFNQGRIGLCTAACFYHHIIQKEPAKFESFAKALYGGGIGFLGNLKVAPDYDLRNADYNALASQWPNMPPQADWMLMSALRDSENWFFDYEGAPDEDIAMETPTKELCEWYKKTGFYTDAVFKEDRSITGIKAINKTANNHIVLWIRTALLQPGDGTHVITLESPITVDEANDKITFDYWTWANPIKTMSTSLSNFKANYLGAITATF
ncbi:hypothetical protein [Paenibacillus xylaniclasticus]|uniref:hypothetical protein n=1 Tax=Paenibacillus xylaniclasticus TaxID=588083 RepID=UPI000FDBDA9D|nr:MULTISPECIES: hypothetical protein [Paenibacillus]GFN30044.1 hypothetical protein PCURB6_03040 [Paenibacillus curdlanolyticus]